MTEQELLRLTDELWLGCSESADYHRAVPEVRDVWLQATKIMGLIRRRATTGGRPVTAFVGATNVGKSTLLNRLLGDELAPKRNGPCTAIPIVFEHHEEPEVRISYRGDFRPLIMPCRDSAAVRQTLAAQGAQASEPALDRLIARIPNLLLRYLTIVDTPGFGAVQHGDAEATHERALVDYLNTCAARIVWVAQAEQGIGAREMDFYREHLASICDDIVFTHCEDWSARDTQRYADRFLPPFGRERPRLHFTSAIEGTGIDELREYLVRQSSLGAPLAALVASVKHLAGALDDWFRSRGDRLVRTRLRPDTRVRLERLKQRDDIRKLVVNRFAGEPLTAH